MPDIETKHEFHRSGHRVADLIVAFSAIFISVCSLALAIHHGRTMEQLVEANSRPFVQFDTSNGQVRPSGEVVRELSATISNPGTGAARIEQFAIELNGRDWPSWPEALREIRAEAAAKQAISAETPNIHFTYSSVAPSYLKGGGELVILRFARVESTAALWDYIDAARQQGRFTLKACYCSIFDQCWTASTASFRPIPAKQCS